MTPKAIKMCGCTIVPRWEWSDAYKKDVQAHHKALRTVPPAGPLAAATRYARWLAERDGITISPRAVARLKGDGVTFIDPRTAEADVHIPIPNRDWKPWAAVIHPDTGETRRHAQGTITADFFAA